jgi:hypothetical protein
MTIGASPSLNALDVEYRWIGGKGGPIPISDFYRGYRWVTTSQTSVPTGGQINLGAFISTFSGHVDTSIINYFDLGGGYSAMGMYFQFGFFNMMATTDPNAGGFINPEPFTFWTYTGPGLFGGISTVLSVQGLDGGGILGSDYRMSTIGFPWWTRVRSTYGESFGYGGILNRSATLDPNGFYSYSPKQSPQEITYWEWAGLQFFYPFMNTAGTAVFLYKN